MSAKLLSLLQDTSTSPDGNRWHYLTGFDPHQKWNINPDKLDNFWLGYCHLVAEKEEGMSLKEKPIETMPVIGSFHLRFRCSNVDQKKVESEKEPELFDDRVLYALIYCFQRVIHDQFKPPANIKEEEYLICAVRESQQWIEESGGSKFYNILLMLQFPYIKVLLSDQIRYLRPRVLEMIKQHNIKKYMSYEPEDSWEVIFEEKALSEPVVMLGSKSSINSKVMMFKCLMGEIERHHFDNDSEECSEPVELDIENKLKISLHGSVIRGLILEEIFNRGEDKGSPGGSDDEKSFDVEHWLPFLLSIHYFNGISTLRAGKQGVDAKVSFVINEDISNLELADMFINIMNNTKRFSEPCYWLNIGRALHSCDEGGPTGLNKWRAYTDRFNTGEVDKNLAALCAERYSRMSSGNYITIKTLAWYAKEDNPVRYDDWHKQWCKPALNKAFNGFSHTDVARALYRTYWLNYIYSPQYKTWFQFRNHGWHDLTSKGTELSKIVSDDFVRIFERLRTDTSDRINRSGDESFRSEQEQNIKKITILIAKLKNCSFKSCIMREATEFFNHSYLEDIMDMDEFTMRVYDGVIDVSDDRPIVRKGKPEDYLSRGTTKSVGVHEYSDNHHLVKELMSWLNKVFPEKVLLDHFLKFSASCIKGRNSDKIFPIFTGAGDNSKSMIVKLYECAFGQYCIKFPGTLLTGKRMSSSGPTPEIARAKGAKIAVIQELGPNEKMQPGPIKEYTGGDSFYARMLNQNGGDVKAMFKLVGMFNKVPATPYADKAVKNRITLLPFLSTWTSDAPIDEKEQFKVLKFKKDPHFERRIPDLAGPFLWILVKHYYTRYIREGLTNTERISKLTEEYWTDHDIYLAFEQDNIEQVFQFIPDMKDSKEPPKKVVNRDVVLSLNDIYPVFRVWFKECYPDSKTPNRSMVKDGLEVKWGKVDKGGWRGIRLINEQPTHGRTSKR